MQDRENTAVTTSRRALEQGQAYRSKAAASAKTRLVNPDQAADRESDARFGNVQSGYR